MSKMQMSSSTLWMFWTRLIYKLIIITVGLDPDFLNLSFIQTSQLISLTKVISLLSVGTLQFYTQFL